MRFRFELVVVVVLLLSSSLSAFGQVLTIGPNPPSTNGGAVPNSTDVDLTTPATASGTVTSATFGFAASCTAAVKIKFFHRSGNTLTFYAERGPFNTTGMDTVALTPPVAVIAGDLIGITQVGCPAGNPEVLAGSGASAGYVAFPGDVNGVVTIGSGTTVPNTLLSIGGTGAATPGAVPMLGGIALVALLVGLALMGILVLKR